MNMIQVVAFVLEAFFAELDIESSENGEEHDQVSIFWSLRRMDIVNYWTSIESRKGDLMQINDLYLTLTMIEKKSLWLKHIRLNRWI